MNKKILTLMISLTLGSVAGTANAGNTEDLNDVYQLALTRDPQVLRAEAVVDVNKEGIVQARSTLLPNINFSTSVSRNTSNGAEVYIKDGQKITQNFESESINSSYTFSLTQEVFSMSTWQQLEQSEKRALQSEVNLTLAKQDLISRVTKIYFDVLKAQDSLEFAKAEKKAIERQLEQTNQRFKVGLTAITDVHEAQAKFDNSVATVIRSENDVEIQRELLREITGNYHAELAPLNTSRFSTSKLEKKTADWVALAENNNRELQAQTISMDIAKTNIDVAFSGHLPTVSLSARKGRTDINAYDNGGTPTNPAPSDSTSIGLTLNVPIFSGFNTDSTVKQAQANYVIASEDRELTHRRISRTIRTNYANVATLTSTIKAQQQAVLSSESALKATEAGFEVGTRTIVDVLDATQQLYRAKSNLSSSRYDYIMAVLNLKLAAGTVGQSDIDAINKGLIH